MVYFDSALKSTKLISPYTNLNFPNLTFYFTFFLSTYTEGNSDKQAGKVYHDIADQKEHVEQFKRSESREHYNSLYQRISRTPQLRGEKHKSHWLHWPGAHPPTPGKHGLHENPCQVKYTKPATNKPQPTAGAPTVTAKRVHTPPTPPDRSRRVKSAVYATDVRTKRAQSLPPTPRSKSASPALLEKVGLPRCL